MRGRLAAVLLTALAAASVIIAPASAAHEPATPAPPIAWHPCQQNAQVECGTMRVPIDRADPEAGTVDVAVARHRATDPAHRIGSLVYMPGGPGDSGVDRLQGKPVFSPEIRQRFDIVSYDPRGIGHSDPVRCDADLVNNPPREVPDGTPQQFRRIVDHNTRLANSCRKGSGALLDHMDSASTAADIDALRRSLGENRISLYGISYGTLAGQMYAEAFPQHVRALLLDSTMDHSLGTDAFLDTGAAGDADVFREFGKWCARTAECALHGRDVGLVYDQLFRRALRGELHEPDGREITPFTLTTTAINRSYGPDWGWLANYLRILDDQPVAAATPAKTTAPFPYAAFCADWRIDINSARQYQQDWKRQNDLAPHLRFGLGWRLAQSCTQWPARVANPQHTPRISGTPPVLVMHSLHDPATTYRWATHVTRQIPDATLATYDGWGHGAYRRSQCTHAVGDRYLLDGVVPAPNTHCPAVPPSTDTTATQPSPRPPWR